MKDLSIVVANGALSQAERSKLLRAEVIKQMRDTKSDLFHFLAEIVNGKKESGWVVMMNNFNTMRFDRNDGRIQNPRICQVYSATLFSESLAHEVAKLVRNGRNENGEVVRLEEAIKRQINNLIECIATLESL